MPISKTDKKQAVLDELRRHGAIARAARRSGVSRRTVWRWRQSDPVFAAAADAAIKESSE